MDAHLDRYVVVVKVDSSVPMRAKRLAAQGRSMMLYYDRLLKWGWWRPLRWKCLPKEVAADLVDLQRPLRAILLVIEEQLAKVEEALEQMNQPALPKGMGTVLFQPLEREVCDWNGFRNRKQVGGFTGLCPCEDTSADRRFLGAINKHGNPRLRRLLIECVWLFKQWNPTYRGLLKWQSQLCDEKLSRARLKKIIVAIARFHALPNGLQLIRQCPNT